MQIQLLGPSSSSRIPLIIAGAALPTPTTSVWPPFFGVGIPFFLMQD